MAKARKADKVVINADGTRTFYVKDFTIDGVKVETSAKIIWGGIESEVFNCGDHFEIREIYVAPIQESSTVKNQYGAEIVESAKVDQSNNMKNQSFQESVVEKAVSSTKTIDELKKLAGTPLSQYTLHKPVVSTAEIMFETYRSKYDPDFDYKNKLYDKVETPIGIMYIRDIIADIANHPKYAYEFAFYTNERFEKGEKAIRTDVEYAVNYAVKFIDARYEDDPELEINILNSKYAKLYLDWIIKNKPRWDLEKSIREQHHQAIIDINANRVLEQMIKVVKAKPETAFVATKFVGDLNEILNPDPLVQTIVRTLEIEETEAKRIADDMRNDVVTGKDCLGEICDLGSDL